MVLKKIIRKPLTGGYKNLKTELFEEKINEVINNNLGKRLAIVSHGAAIKFYLMNWCELIGKDIEYKGNIIKIESPSITKLIFDENMQLKEMYNI